MSSMCLARQVQVLFLCICPWCMENRDPLHRRLTMVHEMDHRRLTTLSNESSEMTLSHFCLSNDPIHWNESFVLHEQDANSTRSTNQATHLICIISCNTDQRPDAKRMETVDKGCPLTANTAHVKYSYNYNGLQSTKGKMPVAISLLIWTICDGKLENNE